MSGRVAGQIAVVVGAGQTPGDTIGNGRAISLRLAAEGATVLAVDRDLDSANETVEMIAAEGGSASAFRADITNAEDCEQIAATVIERHGRVDALVNNVGIGTGDAGATKLTEEAWDLIHDVNLKGMWMTSKHILPLMRTQGSGSIVNISSVAAECSVGFLAYKTSKAAVNALTHQMAMTSAKRGVRVNAIMPIRMHTKGAPPVIPLIVHSVNAVWSSFAMKPDHCRAQPESAIIRPVPNFMARLQAAR